MAPDQDPSSCVAVRVDIQADLMRDGCVERAYERAGTGERRREVGEYIHKDIQRLDPRRQIYST